MILPEKHIKLSESLFGLGGVLLNLVQEPIYIDDLWKQFEEINNTDIMPANHSFDNFILALDYLFIINAINTNQEGKIYLCN